ncbi:MAG: sugar phosphorylase [Victivallaceae bacterium]
MRRRLERLYNEDTVASVLPKIQDLLLRYADKIPPRRAGWSQQDALLITYADSILGDDAPLRILRRFLADQVGKLLTCVHLLPFYPYTSDDGFAVKDFRAVRADLGGWQDVRDLSANYRVVFDGVINHASASGNYMKGYRTGNPDYADFFIALDPGVDTSTVRRPRTLPLLHDYDTFAGKKWLWTTFSSDQPDLNFANPAVLLEMLDVLLGYAENGAAIIRLDAIAYLWKQLGTACVNLPQTHELIKLIRDVMDAVAPHVLLLTETNIPHQENVSYFGNGGDEAQMIYNFSLAPLILWSLHKGNANALTSWARSIKWISSKATYLNITATHDGIGMRPTEGILSDNERAELVQLAYDHGGNVAGKRNENGSITPYELNLNYFDAVNNPRSDEPEDLQIRRFMSSQAIPMSLMGIPGVYIHSLLGSRNDYAGVKASGRARSINREQLRLDDLRNELADSNSRRARVLAGIKRLLAIRGEQSAFHPDAFQEILSLEPELFVVRRHNKHTGQRLLAIHNISGRQLRAQIMNSGVDLLNNESITGNGIDMLPYQTRWIESQTS